MTLFKLKLMKTAWSPLYSCFVRIVKVRVDASGMPVIHAVCGGSEILFREFELERYCL